ATVALAIAAIGAAGTSDAVRIFVSFAQVGRGRRIGMVAHLAHRLFEHATGVGALQRRRGILLLARAFENVAAIDILAAQVAGFAADAHQLLGFPIVGFELVVG